MKTSDGVEIAPEFIEIYCRARDAAADGAKGSLFDPAERQFSRVDAFTETARVHRCPRREGEGQCNSTA